VLLGNEVFNRVVIFCHLGHCLSLKESGYARKGMEQILRNLKPISCDKYTVVNVKRKEYGAHMTSRFSYGSANGRYQRKMKES
jgi:hypothetical protein